MYDLRYMRLAVIKSLLEKLKKYTGDEGIQTINLISSLLRDHEARLHNAQARYSKRKYEQLIEINKVVKKRDILK